MSPVSASSAPFVTPANPQPRAKSVLWLLFVTILIDMLGIGVLIPIFPILFAPASGYRITPLSWSAGQNYILAGWLIATYPLMQFLCAPILGQLADRYGRRKVLLGSVLGTAVSYALCAVALFSHSLVLLFVARVLDGMTAGNISVAQTIIGDISPKDKLARNFGLVGVALGLGFIIGPVVGGKLSDPLLCSWFSPSTPFIFAGLLCLTNLLLIFSKLPETLPQANSAPIYWLRPFHNLRQSFQLTYLRQIIPSVFLFNAGFAFFTTFWGIILAEFFGYHQAQIGNFFGYMGIMVVLAQGGFVRRLSGKVSDYKVLRLSLFGTGLCLLAFYVISPAHVTLIYLIPPFLAIFMALTKSFSNALLTRVSGSEMRGKVMGTNSSANALAQAIPAILAGYLAASSAYLPILIGGLLTLAAGGLFCVSFRHFADN